MHAPCLFLPKNSYNPFSSPTPRYYSNEVGYSSPYGYSQSVTTPQTMGYDISADYVDSTTTYEPRSTIIDSDFIGGHSKLKYESTVIDFVSDEMQETKTSSIKVRMMFHTAQFFVCYYFLLCLSSVYRRSQCRTHDKPNFNINFYFFVQKQFFFCSIYITQVNLQCVVWSQLLLVLVALIHRIVSLGPYVIKLLCKSFWYSFTCEATDQSWWILLLWDWL